MNHNVNVNVKVPPALTEEQLVARERVENKYQKLEIALRYWALADKSTYPIVAALEMGRSFHTGTRKDQITPEFFHQLQIAHYLRTLMPSLMHPVPVIVAALLHDVLEDYHIDPRMIADEFGHQIADSVVLLSKSVKQIKVPLDIYFKQLATCPIASIVKGADRINNLQSMLGVFSEKKQMSYLQEVDDCFLPMLKEARRKFFAQELAYENIKTLLLSQKELYTYMLKKIPVSTI